MADTIFMIHGMWGGPWYWENYKKYFEDRGFRCLTPVLRLHNMDPDGIPSPCLGNVSLLDYADDLEKEIRSLDSLPIIMGHSMGGLLAQILGARGLAGALVLLAPSSPAGIFALGPTVVWSMRGTVRWGFWRKPFRQTFSEAVYSMLHLMGPSEQNEVYSRFVYESGRAAFEIGYWFLDRKKASRVDEKKVTCPVFTAAGKEDRITPASCVRKTARKYGSVGTYREFEKHAHWLVSEPGWEDVAGAVYEWLQKN